MKVYIAAPYELRDTTIEIMKILEESGHEVTSSWLRTIAPMTDVVACQDLTDVETADTLLIINPANWKDKGGGGRHVEMGYAIARGKKIVLLGVRSNIFHHLSEIRVIDRLEDL